MKNIKSNSKESTDFNHYIFSTPEGHCAVIYEEDPFRLIHILLPVKDKSQLLKNISGNSKEALDPGGKIRKIEILILNYFKGKPIQIPFENLPLGHLTSLQQSVLKAVYHIPYGQTRSYGDIAKSIGRPKASRFVGTTMANNPFPLLIPCHRVIKSDGSFGFFGGGEALKAKLIWHEKKVMGDG